MVDREIFSNTDEKTSAKQDALLGAFAKFAKSDC